MASDLVAQAPGSRIMTFHPSKEEFKDFNRYIAYMESQGAHNAGMAKVVPPKDWKPRRSYDDIDDLVIPAPIQQVVTGQSGLFTQYNIQKKPMTVREFRKTANTDKFCNPRYADFEELERKYWKNLTFNPPLYGADVNGSLYDPDVTEWNIGHLNTILDMVEWESGIKIKGVNTPYLYFGMWKSTFAWHTEDMDLYSINYLHFGEPKSWYVVPPEHGKRLERLAKGFFSGSAQSCEAFLRHKMTLISPSILKKYGIPFEKLTQEAGQFVVTFPYGYHAGFNHGFNCAESTNFATERWIDYGKQATLCTCRKDMVKISMDVFVRKFQPERYKLWKAGKDNAPIDHSKTTLEAAAFLKREEPGGDLTSTTQEEGEEKSSSQNQESGLKRPCAEAPAGGDATQEVEVEQKKAKLVDREAPAQADSTTDVLEPQESKAEEIKAMEPESGDIKAMEPESGDTKTMEPESGDTNTMEPESGDIKAMEPESGEINAMEPESGDTKTMKLESGDTKTMEPESGDTKTMKPESGDIKAEDPQPQEEIHPLANISSDPQPASPPSAPPQPSEPPPCPETASSSEEPKPTVTPAQAQRHFQRTLSPADVLHVHSYAKGDYSSSEAPRVEQEEQRSDGETEPQNNGKGAGEGGLGVLPRHHPLMKDGMSDEELQEHTVEDKEGLEGEPWAKALAHLWQNRPHNLEREREYNQRVGLEAPYCSVCLLFQTYHRAECADETQSPPPSPDGQLRTKPLIPEVCFTTTTEDSSESHLSTPHLGEDGTSLLISCSRCSVRVHTSCYGVAPERVQKDWKCARCQANAMTESCCLCSLRGGALQRANNDKWVHVLCAVAVLEARFVNITERSPVDLSGIPLQRFKLKCYYCKRRMKKPSGCCVQCSHGRCPTSYHPTCAQAAGVLMHPDDWPFIVYVTCCRHKGPVHTERNRAAMRDLSSGQRVICKHKNGRYYQCDVVQLSKETFYEVNFDDGSFSDNLFPEDIVGRDCSKLGPPPQGDVVQVRWTDGLVYGAKFVAAHVIQMYQVEFEDGSQLTVKRDDVYTLDEELPKRVKARLSKASDMRFDRIFNEKEMIQPSKRQRVINSRYRGDYIEPVIYRAIME